LSRRSDQTDVAVRLLKVLETNKYACVRDARCRDWQDGVDAGFFEEANDVHQEAAAIAKERALADANDDSKDDDSEDAQRKSRDERAKAFGARVHDDDSDDDDFDPDGSENGHLKKKRRKHGDRQQLSAAESKVLAEEDAAIEYKQNNPKRVGSASHTRYENYKTAKSVQAFLRASGTLPDLRFDYARGYLTIPSLLPVEEPAAVVQQPECIDLTGDDVLDQPEVASS